MHVCLYVAIYTEVQAPDKARTGHQTSGTGVAGCGILQMCMIWELNLGPLQEDQVISTAEPSF